MVKNLGGLCLYFFLSTYYLQFLLPSFHPIFMVPLEATLSKAFNFYISTTPTMLTVGYGDIFPTGITAKVAVIILQLLGFAISSSAVALLLRKILRF